MVSHGQSSTNMPPPALDLVHVSKRELKFSITATAPPSDTVVITNLSPGELAYKIRTTKPLRYSACPSKGILPTHGSQTITIKLRVGADVLSPGESRDRLQLYVMQVAGKADIDKLADFKVGRRADAGVVHVNFQVRFVENADDASTEVDVWKGDSVAAHPREALSDVRPDMVAETVVENLGLHMAGVDALEKGGSDVAGSANADRLLLNDKYENACQSAAELQAILDERNLMLARLRAELSEIRARGARALKEGLDVPLATNKLLSDPFGEMSVDRGGSID